MLSDSSDVFGGVWLRGSDATVYGPTVDLRFKNDTQHHILVATYPDSVKRHLRVEIWGTSDGRTSEVTTPVITNQRPAPAPLFVPDPSIPPGQRRQIDWAAAGATTRFHYTVKNADGSIKHERDFVSNFRPWQAVYLVGVQ